MGGKEERGEPVPFLNLCDPRRCNKLSEARQLMTLPASWMVVAAPLLDGAPFEEGAPAGAAAGCCLLLNLAIQSLASCTFGGTCARQLTTGLRVEAWAVTSRAHDDIYGIDHDGKPKHMQGAS
eukprot:scaffold80960_cov16-Tisochrysis_lutea.AAC.2